MHNKLDSRIQSIPSTMAHSTRFSLEPTRTYLCSQKASFRNSVARNTTTDQQSAATSPKLTWHECTTSQPVIYGRYQAQWHIPPDSHWSLRTFAAISQFRREKHHNRPTICRYKSVTHLMWIQIKLVSILGEMPMTRIHCTRFSLESTYLCIQKASFCNIVARNTTAGQLAFT